MSGGRPTPVPLAINARGVFKPDLRLLAREAERDAAGLTVAVRMPDQPDACATVRLGQGELTAVVLPVVGTWPIDDLSPRGVQRLLRQLIAEARIDEDCHQQALERHAAVALLLCGEGGSLPEWAAVPGAPPAAVEICLETSGGATVPTFWIEDPAGSESPHRLDVDLALLEAVAGPMPLPCHTHGDPMDGVDTWIGFSASDSEGVEVQVPAMDAMETLRTLRAVADARRNAVAYGRVAAGAGIAA